jgi:hypothetical protein
MNFVGLGLKIKDQELGYLASLIDVTEDELHAVLDVETRGSGFDYKNRPTMLFEPHIFYRLLNELDNKSLLENALKQGVAYKKWGTRAYPRDSYNNLITAFKIEPTLALKSASWGLGQIMGFNYSLAGFNTVKEMVLSFKDSEYEQIKGMINFIKSSGLDDELRNHDWVGFARGYNGSGYAKNKYDIKLKDRYNWWSNIPNTDIKNYNPLDYIA